jgi:DNA-binding MarR family transcriptional regulator
MAQPAVPLLSPLHLLHRASQRADDLFARHARPSDLTPRQFVVLQAVAHKDGLSQTDIMAVTGIDRSTTAALVRTLVTSGWLKRRRTRRDARVYAVRITPSGRQMLDTCSRYLRSSVWSWWTCSCCCNRRGWAMTSLRTRNQPARGAEAMARVVQRVAPSLRYEEIKSPAPCFRNTAAR